MKRFDAANLLHCAGSLLAADYKLPRQLITSINMPRPGRLASGHCGSTAWWTSGQSDRQELCHPHLDLSPSAMSLCFIGTAKALN
jgi:hypothetical protein